MLELDSLHEIEIKLSFVEFLPKKYIQNNIKTVNDSLLTTGFNGFMKNAFNVSKVFLILSYILNFCFRIEINAIDKKWQIKAYST